MDRRTASMQAAGNDEKGSGSGGSSRSGDTDNERESKKAPADRLSEISEEIAKLSAELDNVRRSLQTMRRIKRDKKEGRRTDPGDKPRE